MGMRDDYRLHRVIQPAVSMALISVDRAKDVLGIPSSDTSQDGMIGRQIASVSAAINQYCDRIFVQQGYRDQFRSVYSWCAYGHPLMLRRFPIAVDENGDPILAVTQDGVEQFKYEANLDTGALYRLDENTSAPSAWAGASITVDYTAGYAVIPDDIQAAASEWVASRFSTSGRDPTLRSQTIPDIIVETYAASGGSEMSGSSMPSGARDLLAGYIVMSV